MSQAQLSPLEVAIQQCANYRKYLDGLSIEGDAKTKAYLIDKADIQKLLEQNGGLEAIRIYIGHEIIKDQSVVRLHMVACTNDDEVYNDWEIPSGKESSASEALVVNGRPCPTQCSSPNSLNS